MSEKLVFAKDILEGMEAADRIHKENPAFFNRILIGLKKSSSTGIRKDIFDFFSGNAAKIPEGDALLQFHLVGLASNPKMTVEHIRFVMERYAENHEMNLGLDDFDVVFTSFVEKGVPMSDIRKVFSSNCELADLFDYLNAYKPKTEEEATMDPRFENKDLVEVTGERTVQISESVIDDEEDPLTAANDVDMFNNMVDIMTLHARDGQEAVNKTQSVFNGIVSKIQACSSELSLSIADVVNSMENDKKEIRRLNSVITLMQKLLASKQVEINELRGEVVRLNDRIRNSEKAEMRREALTQKINEVFRLAYPNENPDSDEFLSLNQ